MPSQIRVLAEGPLSEMNSTDATIEESMLCLVSEFK